MSIQEAAGLIREPIRGMDRGELIQETEAGLIQEAPTQGMEAGAAAQAASCWLAQNGTN
ncbi:hypothetical protein ABEO98_21595 [Brevibacillus parabrevis]|uniref:hypothetical protein n=1 Tax=Brevibacillus parabrevis TaxID=54914 RepID=UPI002E241A77|nr:hypothetical protein [Brevibacillus parabrevis]